MVIIVRPIKRNIDDSNIIVFPINKPKFREVTKPEPSFLDSLAGKAKELFKFEKEPVVKPISEQTLKPISGPTVKSIAEQKESSFLRNVGKFATATGIGVLNIVTEALDFSVDLIARSPEKFFPPINAFQRVAGDKLLNKWKAFYEGASDNIFTQQLKEKVDKLEQIPFIQPTKEWVAAPIKEKLTDRFGETLFNIGPSIISSIGLFALNPVAGLVAITASTANDIKEDAIANGVDIDSAEKLGLAAGIVIGALERIVPSRIFGGNLAIKNKFLGSFIKRLTNSVLLESGTEFTQEVVQILAELTFKEFNFSESLQRTILAALGGAFGGAGMQVLATFANKTLRQDIIFGAAEAIEKIKEEPEAGFVKIGPEEAKPIPTELQPLAEEAKKFKTAEEFVEAQPKIFRGVTKEGQISDTGVLFFTTNRKVAQGFAETVKGQPLQKFEGGKVIEGFSVMENPLVIEQNEELWKKAGLSINDSIKSTEELVPKIKAKGFDGVIFKQPFGDEVVIFDQKNFKTKQQLTNIFNQSKGEAKAIEVKPIKKTKLAKKERGFITSTREAIPDIKISGQYIPQSSDDLSIKAKNLIVDDIVRAEEIARTEIGDKAVAIASELIKHYGEIGQNDRAAGIAVNIARKLTEAGRTVQAASILGRMTPEGQLRFAAREIQRHNEDVDKKKGGLFGLQKKIPELTPEQAKDIREDMEKITKMPDGEKKAIEFNKLQDKIAKLVPSPMYKKLIGLWKAGLLTGLNTSGLNTFSNLSHGQSEIIKDLPASAVDRAASLFTGKRTLVFTRKGGKAGVIEGFNKGVRYMKTGFDERNVAAKLDYKKVNYGTSKFAKVLQTYEETIFHLMGAEDQPFYYGAKSRSIYSQAIAEGKNKGLKGAEMQKFLDETVKNPTDEMLKNAGNDAEIAVFQNRTMLGEAARAIQKIPFIGEVVVPFGRTPSAVANQLINYSPIGAVKSIVLNIGKGRFDQRAFSQGIGRSVTGTAAMFIGTQLFKVGMLALNFPESEREKKQWELEGKKANSIKIGGKWRSVFVLGPLGITLIVGGYFQRAIEETGSYIEALTQAAFGGAKSLTEQTFLQGINQFTSAINNPESYALNVISRLFASGIPTIISDIAKATDPLVRRAKAKVEGFFAPAVARIPRLRRVLEPRIDVLGRPIERAGNAVETMIDPTRPSRIKSGAVIKELRRLFDAGMPATPTEFGDEKSVRDSLTPEQTTVMVERAGSLLESKLTNLISLEEYKKLSNDEQMKLIKNFTNKSREIARAEMVQQIVGKLSPEEKSNELSQLKLDGFLTKSVFSKWNELFGGEPLPKPTKKATKKEEERTPFRTLIDVFKGITIDPANVARAIFTKEKLGNVEGKLVQLQRDFGEPFFREDGSLNPDGVSFMREEMAKELGIPLDKLPDLRREHIVPVSAGGSNADSNLQLIPTELHKSYTALDTAVGRAVKEGRLSRGEVTVLMRALKVDGTMTVKEVFEAIK